MWKMSSGVETTFRQTKYGTNPHKIVRRPWQSGWNQLDVKDRRSVPVAINYDDDDYESKIAVKTMSRSFSFDGYWVVGTFPVNPLICIIIKKKNTVKEKVNSIEFLTSSSRCLRYFPN